MKMNHYKEEYWKRIYTIQDYIEAHPAEIFTTEQLAKVSCLSKYHLHRIFSAMTNESIFQYATRVKMEWAFGLIVSRKDLSITDIAYELGFSDSSVFSRSFKKYFDISPREVRRENSNNCKEIGLKVSYNRSVDEKQSRVQGDVRIASVKNKSVIYKRIIGSYSELDPYSNALEELYQYGAENDLLDDKISLPLSIYHNQPDLTSPNHQRTSNCIIIKQGIEHVDSDKIGVMKLPTGLYGVIHFEISQHEYPDAWDFVYGEWLPSSGYLPRNSFPFEVYVNNPIEDSSNLHKVDIYIPIESIN